MKKPYELIQKNLARLPDKKKAVASFPIITLSRERGSGGRPIANLVEKQLGSPWKVYNKEIIDDIAKQTKLARGIIKEIDESDIPLIDELIADFFGERYLNFSIYHRNLLKALSTIGQRGHAIIIGRGATFLFPDSLKVRTICEMEQRIKWLMEYENMVRSEAIRDIRASDARRIDFVEHVFKHDPRKAHHYDLVIRTGPHLSIEDAADLIVAEAKRRFKI